MPRSFLPLHFKVLIVEDEFFLARELKEALLGFGASRVEMIGSVHGASKCLEEEHFDLGILDVKVRDEMSYPIADKLIFEKIPFVFVTGYEKDLMPSRFYGVDVLSKPYIEADMITGLKNAMARTAQS